MKLNRGFTGFVPRSRDLLGAGYPVISNLGLSRFTNDVNKTRHLRKQPIFVHSAVTPPPEGKRLYPQHSGMIPRYTGHVPGERFRFGATYGCSTEDARKVLPDVS
ncbi:protein fam166b-like [Plakobranchus ocellatus]|uniref:Protein fam166b-like n=1 Tax=Plakobranchus ocellatus TaxID=259542 RepID=A0AAV4DR39_9GAST|nr:protein fam166b-like [Plakobranchus ocellatus]